tara:strand:- start:3044 stop:3793 length:750 start_codon:yes stop_codon:yes gene_type:complete
VQPIDLNCKKTIKSTFNDMDTHLKVFTYLLLIIITQSCVPPKAIEKKNILQKRLPELKKATQKDIAEVEILVKEVNRQDKKPSANSSKAKQLRFTNNNDDNADAPFNFTEQKPNENKNAGENQNLMPFQKKIVASTAPPKASGKERAGASTKSEKGKKNTKIQSETETSGSNLLIDQTRDYPYTEKTNASEYGKKSAYAQGFQPKQGDNVHKKEDDIIAKQLKDAAIRETDPSLREKLWYEYKRYKSNL